MANMMPARIESDFDIVLFGESQQRLQEFIGFSGQRKIPPGTFQLIPWDIFQPQSIRSAVITQNRPLCVFQKQNRIRRRLFPGNREQWLYPLGFQPPGYFPAEQIIANFSKTRSLES